MYRFQIPLQVNFTDDPYIVGEIEVLEPYGYIGKNYRNEIIAGALVDEAVDFTASRHLHVIVSAATAASLKASKIALYQVLEQAPVIYMLDLTPQGVKHVLNIQFKDIPKEYFE